MGGIADLFPNPDEMTTAALFFMMVVYGYILLNASKTISEGCELLLLLYGPGLIGGLIIPVLGALPDCAIILLSGLGGGTKSEIEEELKVGVGTLCGSTVMVLTIPFGISVLLGMRDYDPITDEAAVTPQNKPKYTKFTLFNSLVTTMKDIPDSSKIMMVTSLSYWIIQLPAFFYNSNDNSNEEERPFALTGFIVTVAAFIVYLLFQLKSAEREEQDRRRQAALQRDQWKKNLDRKFGASDYQEQIFKKHDKDKSGYLDAAEFQKALGEMGLKVDRRELSTIIQMVDQGSDGDHEAERGNGKISLNEFKAACTAWVHGGDKAKNFQEEIFRQTKRKLNINDDDEKNEETAVRTRLLPSKKDDDIHSENQREEEDCEEAEEEFLELTDAELRIKAIVLLLLGSGIVAVFSDPMVDVINQFGTRIGVSAFYVSFVVTPLASNASEIISALLFARKKTNEAISMCFASLLGAACMNNTLSLSIFMALVYFRRLTWSFSAEVISLVIVTVIVGIVALRRNVFAWEAFLVIAMYPICLALVAGMEAAGLD